MANAGSGKGTVPKELLCAKGAFPGTAQNMRRTVILTRMLCCRVLTEGFALCSARGFAIEFETIEERNDCI